MNNANTPTMTTFKNTNFTKLEKQLLRSFLPIQDVYFVPDGCQKINNITFLIFDNEGDLHMPEALKGVIGSLCKKGVLISEDYEDNGFNYIYLADCFDDNQELLDETIDLVKL